MNIIFVGYAVDEDIAETLSGISVAGNKMQLNVLKYIEPEFERILSTTIYPVSSFPNDGHLYYKKKNNHVVGGVYSVRIPFINISGIKQLCQIINNFRELKKMIKKYPDAMLFAFNMYPQVGLPCMWIKKKYGNSF